MNLQTTISKALNQLKSFEKKTIDFLDYISKEYEPKRRLFNEIKEKKDELISTFLESKKTIIDNYKSIFFDTKKIASKVNIKNNKIKNKKKESSLSLENKVANYYNIGWNTRDINKLVNNSYSYNEITSKISEYVNDGGIYERLSYNHIIAEKTYAKENIVNDYLSGKSYQEIKTNLKKNTNGMNISNSTILRIMHSYENKTGKKVVGKRNKSK